MRPTPTDSQLRRISLKLFTPTFGRVAIFLDRKLIYRLDRILAFVEDGEFLHAASEEWMEMIYACFKWHSKEHLSSYANAFAWQKLTDLQLCMGSSLAVSAGVGALWSVWVKIYSWRKLGPWPWTLTYPAKRTQYLKAGSTRTFTRRRPCSRQKVSLCGFDADLFYLFLTSKFYKFVLDHSHQQLGIN